MGFLLLFYAGTPIPQSSISRWSVSWAMILNFTAADVAPIVAATSSVATAAARPATTGFRRHHRQARSAEPTGRATIGSPARNRRRSSASAAAEPYRFAGSFCRHFSAIVSTSRGSARHQPRRRHRLGRLDLLERLQHRRPPERRAADQQLVQDRPQGVDVGERADLLGLALGLLGGHVAGRAQDRLGRRQARFDVQDLGQAEVGDLGRAVGGEQDVARLQVAVDDPQPVRLGDAAGQRLDQRRRPPRRPGGAVEPPVQAAARRRTPARRTAGRRPRRCGGSGRCWGAGAWRRPRPRPGSGRRRRGRRGRRPGSPSGRRGGSGGPAGPGRRPPWRRGRARPRSGSRRWSARGGGSGRSRPGRRASRPRPRSR